MLSPPHTINDKDSPPRLCMYPVVVYYPRTIWSYGHPRGYGYTINKGHTRYYELPSFGTRKTSKEGEVPLSHSS